jgi:1-acyl-sn-glycerol-3-phosphate acyltransferase|tara:strand:- start:456 stop:1367 length:912 start_codon:yes stop_codon:yes gene_type:complete
MPSTLERWLKSLLVLLSLSTTTLFFGVLILSLVPVKFALKKTPFDRRVKEALFGLARSWIYFNNWVYTGLHQVEWRIIGHTNLKPDGQYLLISNHVSSADILAIFVLAWGRLPFPQFFLKQELLYVPVFGQALWSYEMPVMKRYSKEYLNRNPDKRGKDLETAQKSCARIKDQPFTIINFVEGTRFTQLKKKKNGSSFDNLLQPKAGGVHMVLSNLASQLDGVLDLTLAYPGCDSPSFWNIISGRAPLVIIQVKKYALDGISAPSLEQLKIRQGTQQVREWINELWANKDRSIGEMHERYRPN